jgi:phospholipase/carboxylesterase
MKDIDPHADQPIEAAGAPPQVAEAAVVLLHGRGDSPEGILRLVDDIYQRGVRYLAPGAAGRVWFPGGFDAPLTDRRQAYLTSAFGQVDAALDRAASFGIGPDRTVLVGFSQGACVAAEYAVSSSRRYGGLAVLAGGLLGPDPAEPDRRGDLDGTPAYVAAGADDPHVTPERVRATAAVLDRQGAEARSEVIPDLGHVISDAQVAAVTDLLGVVDGGE